MPSEILLTIDDVSQRLGCAPITIRRLVRREELPRPIDFGRRWRWHAADIEKVIAERTRKASTAGEPAS